jgi:hypothetical protein
LHLTVCIAAICESGGKLVTVTDRLLSFGESGVDGALEKATPLHPNWFALYSADDVTDVRPIIDRATILMCGSEQKQKLLTEAGEIFTRSFAIRHQQLIENRILIPSGFKTLDDFENRAKDLLPPDEYRQMRRNMRAVKPQCEFLVGGFDPVGMGHLFVQDSTGPWQGFDDPGWTQIGCGAEEAFTALQFQADKLGFGLECSEAECVYHLLSAKFMAESNRFVGPKTFIACHEFNRPVRYMSEMAVDKVRRAWQRCGIPRLPIALIRRIPKLLETEGERIKRELLLYRRKRLITQRREKPKAAKAASRN